MKKNSTLNFYAIANGRNTGIYDSWSECHKQVDGFKHDSFKGFRMLDEAVDFMKKGGVPVSEIDMVQGEGEIQLKKPLSSMLKIAIKPDAQGDLPSIIDDEVTLNINENQDSDACGSNIGGESSEDRYGNLMVSTDASDYLSIESVSIDGSCKGNGTDKAVSAIGVYWGEGHPFNISEKLPDSEIQTNQTAELTAAVRALHQIQEKGFSEMTIETDSIYVLNGITSWVDKWMKNRWKTAHGNDVKHKELWEDLYNSCQAVKINWVHVGAFWRCGE